MKKPKVHKTDQRDLQQQQAYEGMSRDLYADYTERFRPREVEAIRENQDTEAINERVMQMRGDAMKAWESGRGVTSRALSDYGVTLDATQKSTQERGYAQAQAAGVNNTTNTQRRIEDDRQISEGNEIVARGRRSSALALQGAGQAAGLEAQRGQRNTDAINQWEKDKARRSNKIWGTVAAAALTVVTGGAAAPLLGAAVAGG